MSLHISNAAWSDDLYKGCLNHVPGDKKVTKVHCLPQKCFVTILLIQDTQEKPICYIEDLLKLEVAAVVIGFCLQTHVAGLIF